MLIEILENTFNEAFIKTFPQAIIEKKAIEITRSTHERFGHYQCNSAMKLAKVLAKSPRDIATLVVESIKSAEIEKLEIAGPGFINITLKKEFISALCQQMSKDNKLGNILERSEKIIIDYPSVNAAKEMHVGHLRSTIIGDSLARLFEFLGHSVLRLNHIGDWGTSFGMLIAYIKQFDSAILTGKKKADLSTLVAHYKAAKKLFDEDLNFKKNSQLEVVQLQQGNKEALTAWESICAISRKAHQEIYDLLDIHVIERGESFYNSNLKPLIEDLDKRHLLTLSEGAKCIFLEGFENREGESLPFILQKSDGGFNYSTTDLAAIRHRIQEEKADRIFYVVDAGQSTHFAMLFAAAQKAGYLDPNAVQVKHVGFGVVLGPDGKKFKTRSGETERLIDLIQTAIFKAQAILVKRNEEQGEQFDQNEINHIGHVLGINALKYADLACNRINDYVFSYDRMLKFEGNTAAFLMYSFVRIQGIKRKVRENVKEASILLEHPSEVALGLHLVQFSEILTSITQDLMPNRLCDYLYELSEKFNAFFRDCRVEGSFEQNQRLALCELSATVLKQGMNILGLQTVDRM